MASFQHIHPYAPFLFDSARKWIVGTLPPPRFTQGMLRPGDVDFCYGSRDGQLWPILNKIFELDLAFETTDKAIDQRKNFLLQRGIGICDIVDRAERERIDASDLGMKNIELRDLFSILERLPKSNPTPLYRGEQQEWPGIPFQKAFERERPPP